MDRDDTVKGDRCLDTLDRKGSTYGFYSSSGSERHHHHHHHHPYRRIKNQYFPYDLKKSKAPTFYGEMKKLEVAKA